MNSILGQRIKELQSQAMEKHVPTLIEHYLRSAKEMCGEVGESFETFTCYVCADDYKNAKDEDDVWESLCVVMDCFSAKTLAERVGIKITMQGSDTATINWSGV